MRTAIFLDYTAGFREADDDARNATLPDAMVREPDRSGLRSRRPERLLTPAGSAPPPPR